MHRITFYLSIPLVFFFSSICLAQVGQDSGLWKWTKKLPHHEAIVEVSTSGGAGTGVVFKIDPEKKVRDGFEGYVLTAWHVIQDDIEDGKIKVSYRNGRRSKGCKVMQYDESKDVAVLWVWVPEDIPAAKLAAAPIEHGAIVEFAGLGGGSELECCIRHFSGVASPPSSLEKIFADVPLLPGDSGGPVFNEKHEVVGIISGGWFWFNSGLTNDDGLRIRTTWPARASNIGPIKTLISKLENDAGMITTFK